MTQAAEPAMPDIVERLESLKACYPAGEPVIVELRDAAAEIRRLRAALSERAVPMPSVHYMERGFRWDAESQWHIPNLIVEFEPVMPNAGNDAKGWKDRDAFAALLAAAPALPAVEAPTWRPIETAPADVVVLLYSPRRHETNPARIEADVARNTRGGSHHAWATHWMPLPATPTGEPT